MTQKRKKASVIELAGRYEQNPVIRALVQLIPFGIGSAADVAIATTVEKVREERARVFFDELAKRDVELTSAQIESEDYLHCYFATVRAALNTRRREKVRLFARLFASYTKGEEIQEADSYEEWLKVLDDLSYQEFQVLLILHRYEVDVPTQGEENPLQRSSRFWDEFLAAVETQVRIPKDEIPGVLTRMNRTGLYQTFIGTYIGYLGDKGYITPSFHKFLATLGFQASSDLTPG